ncbi:TonB-linked SusC/RagA family outer membrane protein [Flavobacterium sp. 90]|uniref:SusC/RagA family TonB-linked outer membrane protein n=1 Tax=unclassified Flavobacterium TaxID=196869 RepID=UPI000EADC2B4|nr:MULTISPECIES: SusC/RagA family TonB-linked outer membrane protein [unclassified Flavobacterium]RKR04999.1 TonB-linked SusC/RagA family outer membrane protein [Flavobacterium sp. 81]TCK56316.1 TonB-linked SusC/RagA family outer membrane protein [Flavobacterium sp. 90]
MKKKVKSKNVKLSKIVLLLCLMSLFKVSSIRAETINLSFEQSQDRTVKGKVVDEIGTPLPGVNVIVKGTSKGTVTDKNGEFSIDLPEKKDVLVFTFISMKDQEVIVNGKNDITVVMTDQSESLKEVVLIGYQSVQKKTVTGAMTTVKSKDIENVPYASIDQILAGKVAGLTSLSTSGEPGARTVTNIRGSNSVGLGGVSYPLYVVDGIIYDINDMPSSYGNNPLASLNPNEIESVDVLKDASASAIYGSRGANGVILIKTKQGSKNQRPTFRVNAYTGIGLKPSLRKVTVGRMERQLKLDAIRRNFKDMDQNFHMALTDSLNVSFNNNTDWQDLFIQNARISNVDASVSGAFGKNQYKVSLGYYNETGVIIGYQLKRFSPTMFLSLNLTDKINFTINMMPSYMDTNHGFGNGETFPFGTWGFPSSFWGISDKQKKQYQGQAGNLDEDKRIGLLANTRLNINFTKDLLFTSSFSYNFFENRRDQFQSSQIYATDKDAAVSEHYATNINELENYLTYTKSFNERHNFSAILGQQISEQDNKSSYLRGQGVLGSTVFDISPGPDLSGNSYMETKKRMGIFGRFSYDYKEKYLFSSSYRRDGSSRYNTDKRWTTFYSVAGGWLASEETFFKPVKDVVNFLKFRGSYGVTGNDPASYYAQYNIYTGNASYDNSSFGINNPAVATTYNGVPTVSQNYGGFAGSKDITWEKYPQVNFGIDLNMFNNRIQINADWYARDSKDIFYTNLVAPATSGYGFYSGNAVDIRNTGYEFTVSTVNLGNNSTFKWNTSFNIAFNDNYVTRLPDGGKDLTVGEPWLQYTLTEGMPLFNYRVWDVKGVYSSDSDVPTDPLTGQKMKFYGETIKVGDPKYVDQNGDYIIDNLDKKYAGSPNPKATGGIINDFRYKNWSMSIFCNFVYGRKIWNGYVSDRLNGSKSAAPWSDWGSRATVGTIQDINYYQGPGDTTAEFGTLFTNYSNVDRFHIANSQFIEDGSFFRIKNIRLGYAVPENFGKKIGLSALQFYAMADNVALFTKSTLPDPEAVGADGFTTGNNYPLAIKFTLGLSATF